MRSLTPALTHLALQVRDVGACIAFYQDYCGMVLVHERKDDRTGHHVAWLAVPGREREFVIVLLAGGRGSAQTPDDYGHLGFALASRAEVDGAARRAERSGVLVWPPRQEPYPVGYYCGIRDPDGRFVEFSYGQPLGPGAKEP